MAQRSSRIAVLAVLLVGCGAVHDLGRDAPVTRSFADRPLVDSAPLARTATLMLGLSGSSYAQGNLAPGEHADLGIWCWGCPGGDPAACAAAVSLKVLAPDGSVFLAKEFGVVTPKRANPKIQRGDEHSVLVMAGQALDVPRDALVGDWRIAGRVRWVSDGQEVLLAKMVAVVAGRK